MSLLTNAVLAREKPELFVMSSDSLLSRVREIVRSKCGDSGLVLIVLNSLLAEIQTGRSAVHQYRNFQCAIAAALGGESALQNFIERGARDWMAAKEGHANTVYSLYVEVWPTKKLPF
jgi:oligoribonuclease (3'-5' exoribonuclease)